MSDAISSFATLLKVGDGDEPENFTTIAEVLDIKPPGLELGTEETTNHSSTDGWREFVGTVLSGGDVTFGVNYIPAHATHNASTGLIADMVNRVKRNFQLVFPDAGSTTWSFTALVTNVQPAAPVEGKLSGDVTLKVTGKPTLE